MPEVRSHGNARGPVLEIDAAEPQRSDEGARVAVLARLWGALAREPLPDLVSRRVEQDTLTVTFAGGLVVSGPTAMAEPFAVPDPDLTVSLNERVVREPGEIARRLWGDERFALELDNSVENLTLARAARPEPDGGDPTLARAAAHPDPLVYMEQCVVDGHPLHPGCRTRIGLSRDEVLAYAPEHHPTVRLQLLAVPEDRWYGVHAPPVLTAHPWQYEHVLDAYPFLTPVGEVDAAPLMSLRTLALTPTRHVKTAVDVQMTSAVRTVSLAAIHNGPKLSKLLRGLTNGLTVLAEEAAGAVLVDGVPHRSLAMVYRRMPALRAGEVALPLAALFAPSPATGAPIVLELIGDDPLAWVQDFAKRLMAPLLELLQIGIALEAHGQNMLAVVRDGRLDRLLYRDFGGVRISPRRLERYGIEPPPLRGDLVSDDPDVLRTKVYASALSAVLGELVVVLERELGVDPARTWERVARAAPALRAVETLPLKATTAMRLAADPVADLWTYRPNPMALA